MTYHPGVPSFNSILNNHVPILNVLQRLTRVVKDPPLVAYHHPPNFKNLLVQAKFETLFATTRRKFPMSSGTL